MASEAARHDWDAATYDRVSDPQLQWAREQLERVTLRGDETVLDAGCGSGRVTALLADRVPRGRVYAVDVAPSMVHFAQEALGDRAVVLQQDLVELDPPEPVDLIFSNATFHWIADHDALFAALFRALAPGGHLVAQCGGRGNINGWKGPWNYAGDTETAERLVRAGFTDVSCWLEPKSVTPADPRGFVRSVCLVRHLDRLPEELWGRFIDAVLERTGEPLVLEYVRLNMIAGSP